MLVSIPRIALHPCPAGKLTREPTPLQGKTVEALRITAEQSLGTFQATFDAVAASLETWPRMFCEPDGAFVCAGSVNGERWQVEGVLYDAGAALAYVELSGACPLERLESLWRALGWPDSPLIVEMVEAGVYLDTAEFLRWTTVE